MFYDQANAIIPDYGSSRWVNIEPKFGGRYLPENKSFALTSIAHNTLVVDEKSHFDGKISESSKYHSDLHFQSLSNPNFQIISAKENNAYNGIQIQRTMAMVKDSSMLNPIVIDIIKANSQKVHQYDLPFYYYGHLISTNIKYQSHPTELKPLGNNNGYQHLWNIAEGKAPKTSQITLLNNNRYYSITSSTDSSMSIYFTQIGANDPQFNLRNDPGILLRKKCQSYCVASVIEPHGHYNEVTEFTDGFSGVINEVEVLNSTDEATAVLISGKNKLKWLLLINNSDSTTDGLHKLFVGNQTIEWNGNFKLIKGFTLK
jgi:hypothetical protein